MVYLRIQTNRVKIKEVIGQFSKLANDGEAFIAPSPLPRQSFKFYIDFGKVSGNFNSYKLLTSIQNQELDSYGRRVSFCGKQNRFFVEGVEIMRITRHCCRTNFPLCSKFAAERGIR